MNANSIWFKLVISIYKAKNTKLKDVHHKTSSFNHIMLML